MAKVFLGGTCGKSTWRDALIPVLEIGYFNPVVPNWTPECQEEERRQRVLCDFLLYAITSEMVGVYSIAEAVDDSNKRPAATVLCILLAGFDAHQEKSLKAVGAMCASNGAKVVYSLAEAAHWLNENGAY
jgi:hypothetical protein